MRPRQPGRVGRPCQPGDLAVAGRRHIGHPARRDIDEQQPAVAGRDRERAAVRGRGHVGHPADGAGGQAPGRGLAGRPVGSRDLDRVGAFRVGHPCDLAGLAEHPGQPRPHPGDDRKRTRRALAVCQPVHGPAHLDGAGLAGMIAGQAAQVIFRGDQPRRPGAGRGQAELEQPRPVGGERVEHPDVARAVVDDPLPVGAGVAGVVAVVVGVPPQVAAVKRAGVQVAGALVVGQEREPAADQHGTGELASHAAEQPGEPAIAPRRPHPEFSSRAAPVPLPVRWLAEAAGEQRDPGGLQGHVADQAERQRSRRVAAVAVAGIGGRQRVCRGLPAERLAGRRDRKHLAVRRPAAHLGSRVAPVAEPAAVPAVDPGQVDLGRALPPAGPGDHRAVPGDPGMAGRSVVRGDPPSPTARGRGEPYVIVRDERNQIAVNVREAEVSG